MLNYRRPSFWIIVSAVIAVIVVGIGLLANYKNNEPAPNNEALSSGRLSPADIQASYGLVRLGCGKALNIISPLSGSNAQLAEDVIVNCMVKSAAWPGIDITSLEECYLLRATYSGGTSSDYYAYLLDGKAVMQRGADGYYSRISDDLYEKLVRLAQSSTTTADGTSLETSIADAILTTNKNLYHEGDFAAEAHTILKTVEGSGTTTVYAMVLYMELDYSGGGFSEAGGSHMPAAITFETSTAGEYRLKEYWTPQDGSYYAPSIKEKFPSDIYEDALDTQKYIVAHIQSCYEKAIEHGKINVDEEIAKLIETITSSPAQMSDPHAYIKEHMTEYRKLIYYGNHTLRYCFAMFEKGDQVGLGGHIMASVCRDILGKAEDINLLFDTGQDWYDAFKASAKDLRKENGDEYMKKNMPGSYLLIQMLDPSIN